MNLNHHKMKLMEFMTNLFDLRLIGAMLYLSCKSSQSASLFVCVHDRNRQRVSGGERGHVRATLSILNDDTFNLGPAKEIKKLCCY